MNRKTCTWILAAAIGVAWEAALPGAEKQPPEGDAAWRVMTFNIRYDNPADGPNAWPHRRDAVARILRDQRVDVAGLQEARSNQIDDLQQRLPDFAWYGVGREDGRQGGEFVPIFYRKDRFEPVDQGDFWLSETPEQPGSRSWDSSLPRLATWIRLKDRRSAQILTVVNTHFDHRGPQARQQSARLLLERIPRIADGGPVVLTGDFNTTPATEPYRILTGTLQPQSQPAEKASPPDFHLQDARVISQAAPQGPASTWNGFSAIVPQMRIDFVFTHGLKVASHQTLDDRTDGRFPSDHLPVVVEVLAD